MNYKIKSLSLAVITALGLTGQSQLNGVNPTAATQPQRCVAGTPRTYGVDFKYRF